MTDSFAAELRDLIDRTFVADFGSAASGRMVENKLRAEIPQHLADYLIGKGLRARITAYFNEKDDDGLPKRPAINAEGIHADSALLSPEECGFVYDGYLKRIDSNSRQAEKWRWRVLEQHGIDLAARSEAAS